METLEHLRHYLPTQGPIKDFIHHNTLHAFQDLHFEEAVHEASNWYGTKTTLPSRDYFAYLDAGKIDAAILESVIEREAPTTAAGMEIRRRIQERIEDPQEETSRPSRLRHQWDPLLGDELDAWVNPVFFRLVSQFLDQGIATWRMPGADDLPFYDCIRGLVHGSRGGLVPLTDPLCQKLLALPPEEAIQAALNHLVSRRELRDTYLQETLFAHPGWSGLISILEKSPGSLPRPRSISLREFIAVKLIVEVGVIARRLGSGFRPLENLSRPKAQNGDLAPSVRINPVLQWALEETYYAQTLRSILGHRAGESQGKPSFQATFCLDDRECSLRRHLEALDPRIETFGTAGFYGIDAMFWKEGELFPVKSCPVPVQPKHLLRESRPVSENPDKKKRLSRMVHDFHGTPTKSLLGGLLSLPAIGTRATLRLLLDVFSPSTHAEAYDLNPAPVTGPIHLQQQQPPTFEGSFILGYTIDEMADRVYRVLSAMGMTRQFSDLIAIIAHGSSSTNNPYFAAYDCGACSGRPGAPNARAFASMANHPEVRAVLTEKHGMMIPESTRFVGGMHDTCRDAVDFYDIESLPAGHRKELDAFQTLLEQALDNNALERCQKFDLIPKPLSPKKARLAVRERAHSIYEPRPELNHATNASCFVGRRQTIRGLYLDRRAFLQSYDPHQDPTGSWLQSILGAVVPVCGGINLEYYFSRLDPVRFGSGSKLPHNVVGMLGVMNGSEGDLLTGLPTQMTEIHDPVRLLMVIEQQPTIVQKVLEAMPAVADWFHKGWIHLAVIDPDDAGKTAYRFENNRFSPWELS